MSVVENTISKEFLLKVFEMGFTWGRSLVGQNIEDSRAVGRTVSSDVFEPISTYIEKQTNLQGFNSFQSADLGIVQARSIIDAALGDAFDEMIKNARNSDPETKTEQPIPKTKNMSD